MEGHVTLNLGDFDVVQQETDVYNGLVLLVHHWMHIFIIVGEELETQAIRFPAFWQHFTVFT